MSDPTGLRLGERQGQLGTGPGWERLSARVADALPVAEIDAIWVFRPIRQGPREWGTAIVSRVDGDRRRIYTGRYMLQIKGKERGKFDAAVEEVGSGPLEALAELLHEVRKRTEDEEPPVAIAVDAWFPDRPAAAPVLDDAEPSTDAPGDAPGPEADGEADA